MCIRDRIRTAADLQGQGLLNGQDPSSVYSLFGNHGSWYGYSVKQENTQLSFKASGSADIKSHEFSFGFEFEQREDYYWQFNAWRSIWSLMRQQANKHILERDLANPNPLIVNDIYQDTVLYDRLYVAEEQSDFDRNLRNLLGLAENSVEFIDIDSYSPDIYSLDLFSADELLNNGSSYVYYYGYDIYGNKPDQTPTLSQFFEDGSDRLIAPFNPIYTAGYVPVSYTHLTLPTIYSV